MSCDDDEGAVMGVSLLPEAVVNSGEIFVASVAAKCRQIKRPAQMRRSAFADMGSRSLHLARLEGCRFQPRISSVLPGAGEIRGGVTFGMNGGGQRRSDAQGWKWGTAILHDVGDKSVEGADLLLYVLNEFHGRVEFLVYDRFGVADADGLGGFFEQPVYSGGRESSPAGAAQSISDLVWLLRNAGGNESDFFYKGTSGVKKWFGHAVGIFWKNTVGEGLGGALGVSFHLQELEKPSGEYSQFQRRLVGNAGGLRLSGEDESCNPLSIALVGLCFADARPCFSVCLNGIEYGSFVSPSDEFVIERHPVVSSRLHCEQHLWWSSSRFENARLEQVHPHAGILKRGDGSDFFTTGSYGDGGVMLFSDVDSDDGAPSGADGEVEQLRLHFRVPFQREWWSVRLLKTSLVMRGVRPCRSQPTHSCRADVSEPKARVTFSHTAQCSKGNFVASRANRMNAENACPTGINNAVRHARPATRSPVGKKVFSPKKAAKETGTQKRTRTGFGGAISFGLRPTEIAPPKPVRALYPKMTRGGDSCNRP